MNSNIRDKKNRKFSACGLATALLSASLAVAKSYDIAVDTLSLAAEAADTTTPVFQEDKDMRKIREDRVQLSFVVDPVVVDSVVGEAYEQSALDAVADSPFEAAGDDGVQKAGAAEERWQL